ncbi:hypothetical protein [Actinokineospora sp.]|uniref:hypothetical protein n=1 Tax=Actinokineospora sp. TaxID=1872133 RepID=UPI004037BFEF
MRHRWNLLPILFTVVLVGCAATPRGALVLAAPPAVEEPAVAAVEEPVAEPPVPAERPVPVEPPAPPVGKDGSGQPATLTAAVRAVQQSATVGVLVLDRDTGTEIVAEGADRQFRSASLVKLLIAIDVLRTGADTETRARIRTMLTLSDDAIASNLWVRAGGSALVTRTAGALGLSGTRPPATPGRWGDVLLTARDMGRVYTHVLTDLPAADRTLIVNALADAPRHAADGFDQHFGIPDGLSGQWAVKQGWSDCPTDIVLHSTGLVGPHWRYVVVLLTEHPVSVRWRTAAQSVTAGAQALNGALH